MERRLAQGAGCRIQRLKIRSCFPGGRTIFPFRCWIEDRFFLYFALQAMRRGRLLVYAPTIPPETRANLPSVTFVESLEAGLAYGRLKFPIKASLLIFPHGGSTYPILPM